MTLRIHFTKRYEIISKHNYKNCRSAPHQNTLNKNMVNITNKLSLAALLLRNTVLAHGKSLRSGPLPIPHPSKQQEVSSDNRNLTEPRILESPRNLQTSSYSIVQLGDDIDGEDYYGRSGSSLALSGNGKVLAIGSYAAYGYTGHVLTHAFDDDTQTWVQRGQKIIGEGGGDHSGSSLSMSYDGMTLAIGKQESHFSFTERPFFYINSARSNFPHVCLLQYRCAKQQILHWTYKSVWLGCRFAALGPDWS